MDLLSPILQNRRGSLAETVTRHPILRILPVRVLCSQVIFVQFPLLQRNPPSLNQQTIHLEGPYKVPCDPPDYQKDAIYFVFNDLSPSNLSTMVAEFSKSVTGAHLPWLAKHLVQRVSIGPKLHTLYMDFLDGLVGSPLCGMVLQESYI